MRLKQLNPNYAELVDMHSKSVGGERHQIKIYAVKKFPDKFKQSDFHRINKLRFSDKEKEILKLYFGIGCERMRMVDIRKKMGFKHKSSRLENSIKKVIKKIEEIL